MKKLIFTGIVVFAASLLLTCENGFSIIDEIETEVKMSNNKFLVINAIPPSELQDHLFWEEWYLQKERGEIHHHVLSLWRPQSFNEVFRAPEFDEIHPEECFGRLWYVIEDPDKRPWLLRR
jgi:hypothetical protein